MITTKIVLGFLRKHWTAVVVGAIILVQSLALSIAAHKLRAVNHQLDKVQATLAVEKAEHQRSITTLTASIQKQNAAIQAAAAAGKTKAAEAKTKAVEQLAKPLPTPVAPGADSMNKWLEAL